MSGSAQSKSPGVSFWWLPRTTRLLSILVLIMLSLGAPFGGYIEQHLLSILILVICPSFGGYLKTPSVNPRLDHAVAWRPFWWLLRTTPSINPHLGHTVAGKDEEGSL